MSVFDDIRDRITEFRQAIYGKEVRTGMSDSMEELCNRTEEAYNGYGEAQMNATAALAAAGPAADRANAAASAAEMAAGKANAAAEALLVKELIYSGSGINSNESTVTTLKDIGDYDYLSCDRDGEHEYFFVKADQDHYHCHFYEETGNWVYVHEYVIERDSASKLLLSRRLQSAEGVAGAAATFTWRLAPAETLPNKIYGYKLRKEA